MRAALLVASTELRRRLRNRSALFTAFVGPLALASVFGVLLGGTSSFTLHVGIVDQDRSAVTAGFVSGVLDTEATADSPVRFHAYESQEAAGAAMDDDELDAAIVLPEGFGDAVMAGQAATVSVLRDPGKEVSGGVAASIARQFTVSVSSRRVAVGTVMALGSPMPSDEEIASMSDSLTAAIVTEAPGGHTVNAATFFGASMSILFLFFTVAFAARSLIVEQKTGIVPRIVATSTSLPSIAVGKVLAVGLLGLAGFATVWAATTLLFGSSWGSVPAVFATMVATVLAVAGVATFVCGLARTEEQADGYTSAVAFALALLGGNFLGPGQAPEALQRTAAFTPNGQSLDAFTRIAADGAAVPDVARQLAVLLVFAIAFGGLGLVLIHRRGGSR